MLNNAFPIQVNPYKLADSNISLQGEMLLACFDRLCSQSFNTLNMVQIKFIFKRDERKSVVINSIINTEGQMVCQRCLELFTMPIHSKCNYVVVKEGADTQSLLKDYEVLELSADHLNLHELIEDELLLALPIVPVHNAEECQQPTWLNAEPKLSDNEIIRYSPFSILAQFKHNLNV
ncbi:YceD family protein [Candidatus Pseudomonas adelgestsugas]|nr:YceD family protein [Candidatus Pseudomonas adelgestsugas]